MSPDLHAALAEAAEAPILLVVCDYDGTLAPLVDDPAAASPDPAALDALRRCAALSSTYGAILTGRSVAALKAVAGSTDGLLLVGMHGAEEGDRGVALDATARSLLERVTATVRAIAASAPGLLLEEKPAGVALHSRMAPADVGEAACRSALAALEPLPGVLVRHGKHVVEFLVVPADKGTATRSLAARLGATCTIVIGDDRTDEDAFAALRPSDLGIRVDHGNADEPTRATHRVADPAAVATLLERLHELRAASLARHAPMPLDRCRLLSDQRTVAVEHEGSIVWLCLPRADSPPLFAELLGPDGGAFSIAPLAGGAPRALAYDGDSFILVAEWPEARLVDWLDVSGGRAYQQAGRVDLMRSVENSAPVRVRFAPRLDFGRIPTRIAIREGGLEIEGSPDPIVLRAPGVAWTIVDEGAHQAAEALLPPSKEGAPWTLELRYGTANLRPAPESERERRDAVRRFWSGWAQSLRLPEEHAEVLRRSALVLKALCYGPSGAILAAATTSLPEQLGGSRNWDYRFCWPRDAALAAAALVRVGNTGHALRFLDWILSVVDRCDSPERLRPIYTVTGGHLPSEGEIGHLEGYGRSRPVRIGNAAAQQVQLDVFGPIVDLAAMLAERGAPVAPDHWRLVRAMARAVESRWREPDHGIWEMRVERRHHVHSKAMCWHTIDRALVVEDALRGTQDPSWIALRDEIRADILAHGWSEELGAFSGAYGHAYLDAATLLLAPIGLLPADDPRWIATVERIESVLREGIAVRRYDIDDGLPGIEGGLHICTGWLIEALLSIGRRDEARRLFERLLEVVGVGGILTEEWDPRDGRALGNFAQAYSHLAVINAAIALGAKPGGASVR